MCADKGVLVHPRPGIPPIRGSYESRRICTRDLSIKTHPGKRTEDNSLIGSDLICKTSNRIVHRSTTKFLGTNHLTSRHFH
jgi:hypothetical protein